MPQIVKLSDFNFGDTTENTVGKFEKFYSQKTIKLDNSDKDGSISLEYDMNNKPVFQMSSSNNQTLLTTEEIQTKKGKFNKLTVKGSNVATDDDVDYLNNKITSLDKKTNELHLQKTESIKTINEFVSKIETSQKNEFFNLNQHINRVNDQNNKNLDELRKEMIHFNNFSNDSISEIKKNIKNLEEEESKKSKNFSDLILHLSDKLTDINIQKTNDISDINNNILSLKEQETVPHTPGCLKYTRKHTGKTSNKVEQIPWHYKKDKNNRAGVSFLP